MIVEKHLAIAAYHFHFRLVGNPLGPTLLFLHGFMGDSYDFDAVLPFLWDDFCCLILDLPGHGQTKVLGEDRSYGMDKTAIALINLLQHLQLTRVGLIGYSMGGRLALYLALYFPEYFSQVILESASPGLKTAIARQQRINQDSQWIKKLLNEEFSDVLTQWYQQPLFASLRRQADFPLLWARRLGNSPQALAQSLQYLGTGQQPCLWQKLAQGSIPLMLLVGGQDRKFVEINREMTGHYPQAQLTIFPDCGHSLHLEDSPQFAHSIKQFLSKTA
jgi:2-succinyl-6-hydroxy-2,4-cyclohexadiene-1-carboxylate synthase